MAVMIRMPDFGTAVSEVRITRWLVEEGAAVKRGDLLAEIETDKAATELESIAEGILLKRLAEEGALAESGQIIAWIGAPGEVLPANEAPKPKLALIVGNLAAKLGVDTKTVEGTGERGVITRADVLRAAQERPRTEQLSRSQAAVARAVEQSNREIPHLRIVMSIDMTAAAAARERLPADQRKGYYDACFVSAMARATTTVPLMAARLEAGAVVRSSTVSIAVAVSSGTDLLLPVIHNAAAKPLEQLREEIAGAALRARTGTLRAEETTGASMAFSNLGMYPVDQFDALIFPGHTAILALGAAEDRAVVHGGNIEIRRMATVTLAADHRLINGRTAAEYLTKLKELVEQT